MSRRLRVILSFVMLAVVLFTAFPKVYIHKLMGHTHIIHVTDDAEKEPAYSTDNNTPNCELDKFETPVYFTIFKFILNCSPFRHQSEKVSYNYTEEFPVQRKTDTTALRGPPAV